MASTTGETSKPPSTSLSGETSKPPSTSLSGKTSPPEPPASKTSFRGLVRRVLSSNTKPKDENEVNQRIVHPSELKQAAVDGDLRFVQNCVGDTNEACYLALFEDEPIGLHCQGNILHLAVRENKLMFLEKVLQSLQKQVIKKLLLQPRSERSNVLSNPLHYAASFGNSKAVNLILTFCKNNVSLFENAMPWLQRDHDNRCPCLVAIIECASVKCASEILDMDLAYFSNLKFDKYHDSLLKAAMRKGFTNIALQILKSQSFTYEFQDNHLTPLHYLPHCSEGEDSQEICKLLIEKAESLVSITNDKGHTIFHYWAQEGNVWPFEYIFSYSKESRSGEMTTWKNKLKNLLRSRTTRYGLNPFHMLANFAPHDKDAAKIAEILKGEFKKQNENEIEIEQHLENNDDFPWLAVDDIGYTPFMYSIFNKSQSLATHMKPKMSGEIQNYMMMKGKMLLLAIENGCDQVAREILREEQVDNWTSLTDDDDFNALHAAPNCDEAFVKHLLKENPKLMDGISSKGLTIFHSWMIKGDEKPFEWIFDEQLNSVWRDKLPGLFLKKDSNGCTVFHYAAQNYHGEKTDALVRNLAQKYIERNPELKILRLDDLPWFVKDSQKDDGPLHVAIKGKHDALAIKILKLVELHEGGTGDYHKVLRSDKLKCKTLFLAIQMKCYDVAREIINGLQNQNWIPYLENPDTQENVLHLLHNCTDESFGEWLTTKVPPEFITKKDRNGKTPLHKAAEAGADWLVRAMLQTNPVLIFRDAPLAWVDAAVNSKVSTVRAFIDCYPGSFKDLCLNHKTTPLHHIRLSNVRSYEDFLKLPYMKDLINEQDPNGVTPLHKAIRNNDIYLTEALLNNSDTNLEAKDNKKETARSLLARKYRGDKRWENMCRDIRRFDPTLKINYLQRKTNLVDVRQSLFVVAALIATITFTAGFTLPGGLKQDDNAHAGEALLAKKEAFVVFIISDTLGLCFSMLVLIFLIWSTVDDSSRSMSLIDQSMSLLMISLVCTMITFMFAVFLVISKKKMWVAILVIVMSSAAMIAIICGLLIQPVRSVFCRKYKNYVTVAAGARVSDDSSAMV